MILAYNYPFSSPSDQTFAGTVGAYYGMPLAALGGKSDGTTDDSAALAALATNNLGHVVIPGVTRVSANVTPGRATGTVLQFLPGAQLTADAGVTVSLSKVSGIIAPDDQQIFTGAGTFAGLDTTLWHNEVSAMWFPGADLGARIQAALDLGFHNIRIPSFPTGKLMWSTTVSLKGGVYVSIRHVGGGVYGPSKILVRNSVPTAAMLDLVGSAYVYVDGLNIYNDGVGTPACIILTGRKADQTEPEHIRFTKCFYEGPVGETFWYNRAAEVVDFVECRVKVSGAGDFSGGPTGLTAPNAGSPYVTDGSHNGRFRGIFTIDERADYQISGVEVIAGWTAMMDPTTVINRSCTGFRFTGDFRMPTNDSLGVINQFIGAVANVDYFATYENCTGFAHTYIRTDNTYRTQHINLRRTAAEWNGKLVDAAHKCFHTVIDAVVDAPMLYLTIGDGQMRILPAQNSGSSVLKVIRNGRLVNTKYDPGSTFNFAKDYEDGGANKSLLGLHLTCRDSLRGPIVDLGTGTLFDAIWFNQTQFPGTLPSVIARPVCIVDKTTDGINTREWFGTGTALKMWHFPVGNSVTPATANLLDGDTYLYYNGTAIVERARKTTAWVASAGFS